MAKSQDNGAHNDPDHIEQIRDIIFGPQKREYDQRFEKVVAELHRVQADAEARLAETRDALQAQFTAGLGSLERDVRDIAAKLHAEIQTAGNRDVPREALAEMLEEVALKLKGVNILGELRKATARKGGE